MSMEFCEKCGSRLIPKKVEGKVVIICPKCGVEKKSVEKGQKMTEHITQKGKESMVIIENPDIIQTMPTKKMRCPKCNAYTDIQYWTVQTRRADEAPTQFYRCTTCKATWREYQ